MKFTFVSNFMNHHQLPFSDEMNRLCDYSFIACAPINSERLALGYADENKSREYIVRPYESREQYMFAQKLIVESDVVVFGSGYEEFFEMRMERTDKLTFRYNERLFKKTTFRRFVPITFYHLYKRFIKYRNYNNFGVLCASAYTSYDLKLCGMPEKKCYKWGYFPDIKLCDTDSLMSGKKKNSIIWVGRFLDWKHPELPVLAAERLKREGYDFDMIMVGTGGMLGEINKLIREKSLTDCVTCIGSVPTAKVRELVEKNSIFLATSDFQEGWGAVVNEGMSGGCACVVSDAMGSAPYLIEDDKNGMLYRNMQIDDLCEKIRRLLDSPELCDRLGRQACETMAEEWNAVNAARKLMELSDCIINDKPNTIISGVCSRAKVLKNGYRRS